MKKNKPVVLKDSTKLTSSQMKQIRGGYEPETETVTRCTALCYSGANEPEVTIDCNNWTNHNDLYCVPENGIGARCYYKMNGSVYKASNDCIYDSMPPIPAYNE